MPSDEEVVTLGQEFLEHHGVKGMHWGIRNKSSGSSSTAGAKKRRAMSPFAKVGNKRGSSMGSRRAKNHVSTLSDEDLQKALRRLNMEKQYKSLSKTKDKEAADFVKSIGSTAVKTALTAAATKHVAKALSKAGPHALKVVTKGQAG